MLQKKVPQKFAKWFASHFRDNRDVIDLEHEYDRELSIEENQEAFKQKFGYCYYESPAELKRMIQDEKERLADMAEHNGRQEQREQLESRFGIKIQFV